jgi:hypothetical protein
MGLAEAMVEVLAWSGLGLTVAMAKGMLARLAWMEEWAAQ